jgi:hypothetical protein
MPVRRHPNKYIQQEIHLSMKLLARIKAIGIFRYICTLSKVDVAP